MAGPVADRLYLGDELIFDAAGQGASPGWSDMFDRAIVGPDYTIVNLLNQGSAVSAWISSTRQLGVDGYTPAAIRQCPSPDGVLSVRYSEGSLPQLVVRYQDVNNWMSWTPNNGGAGRFRARIAGVSYDTAVPATFPAAGDLLQVQAVGAEIRMLRNGTTVAVVTDARLTSATGVGFASAGTAPIHYAWQVAWAPVAEFSPARAAAVAADALAADTFDALAAAARPALAWMGATMTLYPTPQSPFNASLALSDARALVARLAVAAAEYPPAHRGSLSTFTFHVGASLLSAGSPASGVTTTGSVYLAATPTEAQISSTGGDVTVARDQIIHHELAHLIHMYSSAVGASTLTSAVQASNPPGFTYGGTAVGGPRPTGFCRGYGTQNVNEDIADVFGWLMTAGLRAQIDAWCLTDTYLAGKVAAVRVFLRGIGWPEV